jgi:hypothetical protein
VAAGTPACVFIVGGKDRAGAADPVEALLAAQARSAQPIQLVPLVVVWSRAPEVVRSEAAYCARSFLRSQSFMELHAPVRQLS